MSVIIWMGIGFGVGLVTRTVRRLFFNEEDWLELALIFMFLMVLEGYAFNAAPSLLSWEGVRYAWIGLVGLGFICGILAAAKLAPARS